MALLLVPLLLVVLLASCGVFKSTNQATSFPRETDVAVSATHDVVVFGCHGDFSLADLVLPIVATGLLVAHGRVDAAFYLPGAIFEGTPKCKATEYTVSEARVTGSAFELEATENPKVFKAHARTEGVSTFTAKASVGGEVIEVTSTLRAWHPNRVTLKPRCRDTQRALPTPVSYVPVGEQAFFDRSLFRDQLQLKGYGLLGVTSTGPTFAEATDGTLVMTADARGPITVTSPIDPTLRLELMAYDLTDVSAVTVEQIATERLLVGQKTSIRSAATVNGKEPCRSNFSLKMTNQTPAVCRFANLDPEIVATEATYADLEGLAPGTCTITAALAGSPLTATLTVQVSSGFASIPLPNKYTANSYRFEDLWVDGPEAFHLVGWRNTVVSQPAALTLQRSGGAWQPITEMSSVWSLHAVHGLRDEPLLFSVGGYGAAARWNGSVWTKVDAGTPERLNDVWVEGPNDVYVVGDQGTFLHHSSSGWVSIDAGTSHHLRSIWGDRDGGLFLAGAASTLKRFDGSTSADVLPADATDGGFFISGIIGSSPADLWVHGGAQVLHFDGVSWQNVSVNLQADDVIRGVWPVGDGFAYILVDRDSSGAQPATLERFDGARTVSLRAAPFAHAITGFGNDVFVLTNDAVLRYRHNPADVFP